MFIDTFVTKVNKSFWMSLMLIAPPIGVFVGYVFTAVLVIHADWRKSMFIIAIFSGIVAFLITLMPEQYVEITIVRKAMEQEEKRRKNELKPELSDGSGAV